MEYGGSSIMQLLANLFFFLSDSFSCFENVTVNPGVYDIEVWSYGVQNKLKNPRKFGNLNEIKLTEVYS